MESDTRKVFTWWHGTPSIVSGNFFIETKIYLQMSSDETHGGGAWTFTHCVWAPTKKRNGSPWPFWNKILQIDDGDIIIHLRIIYSNSHFVGCSIAAGKGFETEDRPPEPGEWGFAERYYRANLTNFKPFSPKVNFKDVIAARKPQLEQYYEKNKTLGREKANIFYARQSGRIQCLNGAYLSDIDDELLTILFDHEDVIPAPIGTQNVIPIKTRTQIATIRARVGHSDWAKKVKGLYYNRCCFPGCTVMDSRFLTAAHIARWTDNEELRGHPGNGLCLCPLHDKAFEVGIFTLDNRFQVFVNPEERDAESPFLQELYLQHGKEITLSEILPLKQALLEHRIRVGINPDESISG